MDEAIIQSPQGFLNSAHRLLENGLNMNALRTNALLQKDEWKVLDDAVISVARGRLNGIADLQAAGLTRDVGGLGVLLAEYEKVGDMTAAEQSLSGVTEGLEDIPAFSLAGVPIPITFKDFRVNIRHLLASRKRGSSIDVTAAEIATRQVVEKLEDMLFNGSSIRFGSNTIPGLTTFSDRNTGSLTGAWSGLTGAQIIVDAIAMIASSEADYFYGPWGLWVPQSWMPKLRSDYSTSYPNNTIMDRLLQLEGLKFVHPTSKLTASAVLCQLTSDVIDMPVGQDITTVEWDQKGGLETHFKIMAAMAPRLKSDANGRTGIVHFS